MRYELSRAWYQKLENSNDCEQRLPLSIEQHHEA